MKYYAFIDGNQEGPFDLDELVRAGVRPSTYIWCKTMDDWHRADEVEEVRELFRRHINNGGNASTVPSRPEAYGEDYGSGNGQNEPVGPDLSSVPQSFRRIVQKSGTVPGAPSGMEPDINRPPQISMTLAVISMLLCFLPAGIAAVVFTYKSQKTWAEAMQLQNQGGDASGLKTQAHEYARLSKMWLGLTVALGLIAWTLLFSVR